MPDVLMLYWRTLAGTLGGLLVTWLAGHGWALPDTSREYLTGLLVALGVTVYVGVSHWLQTRTGTGMWARIARRLGQLMVGGAGKVPTYKAVAK